MYIFDSVTQKLIAELDFIFCFSRYMSSLWAREQILYDGSMISIGGFALELYQEVEIYCPSSMVLHQLHCLCRRTR